MRVLLRRLGPPAALAALVLVVAQVVLAAPPAADFTISDATPDTGQTVTFTSTATDPDGDITGLEWDFDYTGTFTADATGASASTSYATPGSYSVALRVTDGAAEQGLAVHAVTVSTPNAKPTGSFTFAPAGEAAGAVADVGQSIQFDGTGSDPDGDPITFEWSFGDGGTATGASAAHSYATPGAKTVTMTVRDNRGGTGSSQATVTVNAPPVAHLNIVNASAEPGQKNNVPLAGQPFAFTAQQGPPVPGVAAAPGCPVPAAVPPTPGSTDAAPGTIASYAWDLDDDGQFDDATGQNTPSPAAGYPAGMRTVGLRVTDNDGGVGDAHLTFRVNSAPAAGFVFEPFTPLIDQPITFSSTATDADAADAGRLAYSWDLDDDGTFCEAGEVGASVAHSFPVANVSPGHRVRLRVTDDGGITREATRSVIVQNTIPVASIAFAPDAPLPGQPVTFTGSASSPTGKAIAGMQWDFDFDPASGRFDVDAVGAAVTHAFGAAGASTVALRVEEAGGGFAIVTRAVSVNAPPRPGFTVTPETAAAGEPVTLSSTSSDPDGPLVRQEWDLDDDGSFDDASAAVVFATFNAPGTYPLRLRVTDGRGASAVSSGQLVVRSRAAAVLTGVVITIKGRLARAGTIVTRLLVRAPKGSKVTATCTGATSGRRSRTAGGARVSRAVGCPRRARGRVGAAKPLRLRSFERRYLPGARLVVTVTRKGFVGKRTVFAIRRGKAPRRRDLCLVPGARRASECPPG